MSVKEGMEAPSNAATAPDLTDPETSFANLSIVDDSDLSEITDVDRSFRKKPATRDESSKQLVG